MPRKSRYQRQPSPMRLTQRDIQVIEVVYAYRVLSQAQIHALLFGDRHPSVSQDRLRKLFDNGYLQRRTIPTTGGQATSPVLYLLDKLGNQVLLKSGRYDEVRWQADHNKIGYEHLEHLMAINRVRIAVTLGCQRDHELQLERWLDDTTLKADYDRVEIPSLSNAVALIPDGFFELGTFSGKSRYFLEMDRGTMTHKRFRHKIEAYHTYRTEKVALKERFGTSSFRLLTVTESETRTENLLSLTKSVEAKLFESYDEKNSVHKTHTFWFATLSDLTATSFFREPIWMTAKVSGKHPLWQTT